MQDYTLAELCIVAAAQAWRNDGEVLASGIGLLPRLAASLAKLTFNPALLMTDSECMLVAEPVPVGPRKKGSEPVFEGWMPYARTFDLLWRGRRHAMVGPVQIDRYGQSNISFVGEYARPKSAFLGVRGFPGNTINHANSMFVPSHSTRVFVAAEVDMVGGVGYNAARWPGGRKPAGLDLRIIVTDLAVLDFEGPDHQIRVASLHPGIAFEQVQENTGFPLARPGTIPATVAPTGVELDLIRRVLDPHDLRATVFKGNPPGDRAGRS